MRYLLYTGDDDTHRPVCVLVPRIQKEEIQRAYLDPYQVDVQDVLVLDLYQEPGKKKTSAKEMKRYIEEELVPSFHDMGAEYLVVTDSDYFKALTKVGKTEAYLGYVLDCAYGPWKVVYVPNYRAIFYDPDKVKAKIGQGMRALQAHRQGTYQEPGANIIGFEAYPRTVEDIASWLQKLLDMNCPLSIDIEAFDLKHHKAGIATITFCWSKTEGIAFPVDYEEIPGATAAPYGKQGYNAPVRELLKAFFTVYTQRAIYHNIAFDAYVLIYQLYMTDLLDTDGLLDGMEILLRNWHCTKLISYLATNSCAGNKLGLKDQAQEYAGNWAVDEIKDVTRIPLPQLLQYNLVDGLSTWYVYEKHWDTLVADKQQDIYETLFQPATVDIIQMQLTGIPINMGRVAEVKLVMQADEQQALTAIHQSPIVQAYTYRLNEKWVEKRNAKLKKKQVVMADANETFNPNSGPQLQDLLFEVLGLPVLNLTDSKQPATDGDTLKALRNHTEDERIKSLLQGLLDYSAVNKILTSFIPAMENAARGPDGWHYLSGNFNLGGTVSGRLSSSNPNLQNLPANSKYAKLIKSCVQAPPGWLFVGLDFALVNGALTQ